MMLELSYFPQPMTAQAPGLLCNRQSTIMPKPASLSKAKHTSVVLHGKKGETTPVDVTYKTDVVMPTIIIRATLLIDASYSMNDGVDGTGQTRMGLVLEHIRTLFVEVLQPDDLVTLAFFNSKYKQVWVDSKVKNLRRDMPRLRAEAEQMLAMVQCTELWDKTLTALESMRRRAPTCTGEKDVHGNVLMNLLLVFTDGADNASSSSMGDVVASVARPQLPNFHFLPIIIDAPYMAMDLIKATSRISHVHVSAERDASSGSIRKVFADARKMMSKAKAELVETLVLQLRSSAAANGPAQMPGLLKQLSGMNMGTKGQHVQGLIKAGNQKPKQAAATSAKSQGPCRYGRGCTRPGCCYDHPI